MAIDFQHNEYAKSVSDWELVDHISEGDNVKDYLIELNPSDTGEANKLRNKQYKERAVFYNVAGYTLQGLIGLMFSKFPKVELPLGIDYLLGNANGDGVSLYQQSQKTAREVLQKGRAGLFVSYPKTSAPVSRADMDSGGFQSTIHLVEAEQILNWRVVKRGSQSALSLVVISESVDVVGEDGYSVECVEQIRELALQENVFVVREWRKDAKKKEWAVYDESIPTDAAGNSWSEIPFVFLGSVANTPEVNSMPLLGLAKINISHYRNSADYEDSVWYSGQSQPWMSGVTQTHLDLMQSNKMYVGSRNVLGVPTGESFGFASAPANSMVRQAMLDKLEMMIGLGARFIQGGGKEKTATEAGNDARIQHSSLALVSSNLSEGYGRALEWAARYMGVFGEVKFETTTDFTSPRASAQDIQAMVAGFVQGAIPMGDYFNWLKKVELVDSEKTVDEFGEEIGRASMPDLDE